MKLIFSFIFIVRTSVELKIMEREFPLKRRAFNGFPSELINQSRRDICYKIIKSENNWELHNFSTQQQLEDEEEEKQIAKEIEEKVAELMIEELVIDEAMVDEVEDYNKKK